ncbi:CKLF-like MARVEL transmembrane domain-containing protein 7 [Puma concolor]|uniref:CKLF-like MARVEL transmembrane domain-containing protein 7 n=1 Tax=Puma concolor TaxID=9696 RepID=A0A6P6H1L0_PUMCO|nr:CKLF-like MARVEL transmembrane domain-containing protein 7 [Puma concolor]
MQHSLEESVKEVKAIGAGLIRWLLTPTLAMMLRVPDTLSARFDFGTLSRGNFSLVWPTALVTLLIAFICVRSSVWTRYSAYSYFEVVTICNLIMILVFYLVHLFRLYRVLTCISWPLSELLHYLIGTLLLLIASIVAASKSYSQSGLVAGAIFGFVATFLCLASIWLSYKISCVTQSTAPASSRNPKLVRGAGALPGVPCRQSRLLARCHRSQLASTFLLRKQNPDEQVAALRALA